MKLKERNYGIDLLRLVLMYMVCMLHTLKQGGILEACDPGSAGYKAFWLLEVFSFCAVDGFAIISGYMAKDKPCKYDKIINMWFQVFFYSFIVTLIFTLVGVNDSWGKIDIIKSALPVTTERFWYFTAFFALFLATPILNKFIFSIDTNTAKKCFIIFIVLFAVMGNLGDPFQSKSGYSTIWLVVLYCVGALAKKIQLFESKKSITLILMWAASILVTWAAYVFLDIKQLVRYISPTILLNGMIMVILFSRLKLKGTIISKLSPLAFGIYLFQLNQVVWSKLIKGSFAFVASKNLAIGILYSFAFAFLIFISGLIVEAIRSKAAQLLRLPLLSKKIAELFDKMIVKLFVFLK